MASHFNFEKTLSELTKLDAPLQRGPPMRWQRKAMDQGLFLQIPKGLSPKKGRSGSTTPSKTPNTPLSAALYTPKTPSKTPKKGVVPLKTSKTPNKKMAKTPTHGQKAEDRFIPNRSCLDLDLSHYAMVNQENADPYTTTREFQQKLTEALGKGENPKQSKILTFRHKSKLMEGQLNNHKVLYSTSICPAPKALNCRYIPRTPEKILDAPDLLDDYYLNLMDWSVNDNLAIALGSCLYLWNPKDGTTIDLCGTEQLDEYIGSVSWMPDGNIIAISTNRGVVELWDVGQKKMLRSMEGHSARVGCLSWNAHILSSGSRSGAIHHHDVRVPNHQVATLLNHQQEVCGLKWSPDGRYLASGGNDNLVNIWDVSLGQNVSPVYELTHHQAAVKAIAWCPWQPHVLATGGGTADRAIRFWNVMTGAALNAVDTSSQVCGLLWSPEHKEIISGHGYVKNQLILWKYPAMKKVTELQGHTSRILALAMSPDRTMVMSAAADETVRLWNCFAMDKPKKSISKQSGQAGPSLSMMHRGIR